MYKRGGSYNHYRDAATRHGHANTCKTNTARHGNTWHGKDLARHGTARDGTGMTWQGTARKNLGTARKNLGTESWEMLILHRFAHIYASLATSATSPTSQAPSPFPPTPARGGMSGWGPGWGGALGWGGMGMGLGG